MSKPAINDYQLRILLDAWIVLDNPSDDDEPYRTFCDACSVLAHREAKARGYDSVPEAYHEHPQLEELTDTEK